MSKKLKKLNDVNNINDVNTENVLNIDNVDVANVAGVVGVADVNTKIETEVMPPLPTETTENIEKVEPKIEPKAEPKKQAKKFYAFCRISGGLIVDIIDDLGDVSKKILKSGNTSKQASDGTLIFDFRPESFGITELTAEEAKQIKKVLEPTKAYKKGFVFIVESLEEGYKKAKEQVINFPKQGTEQLNADTKKEIEKFSE